MPVIMLALVSVGACAIRPDTNTAVGTFVLAPRSVTLTGVVTKKECSKDYESYNAGGGYYYVLDVRNSVSASGAAGDAASHISTVAPNSWTAREGVILRASKSVRFEDFARFEGKRVIVQGTYVEGDRWRPPADYGGQYMLPSKDPRTGEEVWPIRGSGFEVQGIKVTSDPSG